MRSQLEALDSFSRHQLCLIGKTLRLKKTISDTCPLPSQAKRFINCKLCLHFISKLHHTPLKSLLRVLSYQYHLIQVCHANSLMLLELMQQPRLLVLTCFLLYTTWISGELVYVMGLIIFHIILKNRAFCFPCDQIFSFEGAHELWGVSLILTTWW